jgi:hypothetical protein
MTVKSLAGGMHGGSMMKQLATSGLFVTLLTACSQLGSDDEVLKKSLQSNLPAYWEVGSLNLENRENLGSQSDPSVQSRFKAIVRLKEDTATGDVAIIFPRHELD